MEEKYLVAGLDEGHFFLDDWSELFTTLEEAKKQIAENVLECASAEMLFKDVDEGWVESHIDWTPGETTDGTPCLFADFTGADENVFRDWVILKLQIGTF